MKNGTKESGKLLWIIGGVVLLLLAVVGISYAARPTPAPEPPVAEATPEKLPLMVSGGGSYQGPSNPYTVHDEFSEEFDEGFA